jgi:hypothetical protein
MPQPDDAIIDALTKLLVKEQRMKRPPRQAARLLAYIYKLHKHGRQPFPPRKEVAATLGMSIPTIDTALSARLAEGYITCEIQTIEGNAKNRTSSIKQRYYRPSRDIIDTARAAMGANVRQPRKKNSGQ